MSAFVRVASWIAIMALGIGIASTAIWLLLQEAKEVIKHYEKLEQMKAEKSDAALDAWAQTFKEEHARRIVAEQKAEQERNMRKQIAKGAKQ